MLDDFDVFRDENWYWIGAGALLGFCILFNILFTFALMYLNRMFFNLNLHFFHFNISSLELNSFFKSITAMGSKQAIISEEAATEIEAEQEESKEEPRLRRNSTERKSVRRSLSSSDGNNSSKKHQNKINPICVKEHDTHNLDSTKSSF